MTFLLYGKERTLKDEAVAQLKAKFFRDASEQDLNFQSFDAEEDGVSPVLDFLSTAPFLASKRLAVLKNVDVLSKEDGERLLSALSSLPSSACLVLETEETNTKKNAALRRLAEKVQTTACHPPFEKDLPGWVEARAAKKDLALDRGVAAFLIGRAGPELAVLDGVLRELALFVHPRRRATLTDATAITPSNPEQDVFKLADLLLERRKKEALTVVDGLYRSGTRAHEIVPALAGQIERYKKALSSLSVGRSPAEVGEEMRVPRMFQAAFFQRLRGTSLERLHALQKGLLECDESFKTGRAEERISIERFVLTI